LDGTTKEFALNGADRGRSVLRGARTVLRHEVLIDSVLFEFGRFGTTLHHLGDHVVPFGRAAALGDDALDRVTLTAHL